MRGKLLIALFFIFIIAIAGVMALQYKYRYNPFTGKQDIFTTETGGNLTVEDLNITGKLWAQGTALFDAVVTFQKDVIFFNDVTLVNITRINSSNLRIDGLTGAVLNVTNGETSLLIVEAGGNVGIGIIDPTELLTIKSKSPPVMAIVVIDDDSSNEIFEVGSASDGDGFLRLSDDAGNTNIRLDSTGISYFIGGNIGLGIELPTELLVVAGNANITGNLIIGADGSGRAGIGTTNPISTLDVVGNASFTRNVSASNIWNTQIFSVHTDAVQCVQSAGVFLNVSFNESASVNVGSISHTANDLTNTTITIGDSGFYDLDYVVGVIDSAASPSGHVLTRIIRNNVEIQGTLQEVDTSKQDADEHISGSIIQNLDAGDLISLQFTSDDTTVCLDSDATYGVHKTSGSLKIMKVGNLIPS